MKTEIIHISQKTHFGNTMRSAISFKKFVDFLQGSLHTGLSIKDPYFKWILKKFKKSPDLLGVVPLLKIREYEEMLELVSTTLLPLAAGEKSLWALSSPLTPEIFYSTDGFYELMNCLKHPSVLNPAEGDADSESEKIIHEVQYGMVLEKIYKLPFLKKTEWIRKFEDPETGLDRYFLVNIDNRFVEIGLVNKLPDLDCTAMQPSSVWGEEFKKIQRDLPLDRFEAKGFSVLTLTDVTSQQAVEEISRLIVNSSGQDAGVAFKEITHSLQTVAGSRHFQFGILPFLTINDRPALLYENFHFSIIVQACWESNVSKKEFISLRNDFSVNPRTIIWSVKKNKESNLPEVIKQAFLRAGISTYIMFPVFNNRQITGFFEVSTKLDNPMISEEQLVKLKPALPLMTQLIKNIIARFNNNIENIIKEKFTSVQPAVQWKFNETAWHYLRDHVIENRTDALESISFQDLHPLYGAVDIRNSTILRNQALEKDYTVQLNILIDTLSGLDFAISPEIERLLTTARNWLQIIRDPLTTQQEIRLSEFFNLDVQYELEHIRQTDPETSRIIDPFFESTDELTGNCFENRRQLESAIQQLNTTINNFYETASAELQQIYPCYFEKFRTDGVEYDIYVGQSIAPKIPFLKENLQQMKRWQLESMIKLVRLTQDLIPAMSFPLQTTNLLFVHPQTIDITFRKDERRFDVEGAYNIRYHIIKKRIDKVIILDSGERLTQPGKIALVYFDERDAQEYKGYIKQMQEQNLLMEDLEQLELESLQGVDGLKALRVGVLL
jgi:hypothetical protein